MRDLNPALSLFIITALLLAPISCTISKQFINPAETDEITQLNEKLVNKRVVINFTDGESVESNNVDLTGDSLRYDLSSKLYAVELSRVSSLVVSPRISKSTIAAVLLFGLGVFGIVAGRNAGSYEKVFENTFLGLLSIGAGAIVMIFGNNAETEIYEFQQQEIVIIK